MGIGESEQIYKQKEKQEIFHGEEQQTQQSQTQSVRQVQKQKEDPLEQTLQQFQVNVQQINLRSELLKQFSVYFSAAVVNRNIDQDGRFKEENKTFGPPQTPAFVKEFIKNGSIPINPDDSLSDDNPQTYKTKDGYVKPDLTINNLEYTSLNVIELLQNMPALTRLNLQEELRRSGM